MKEYAEKVVASQEHKETITENYLTRIDMYAQLWYAYKNSKKHPGTDLRFVQKLKEAPGYTCKVHPETQRSTLVHISALSKSSKRHPGTYLSFTVVDNYLTRIDMYAQLWEILWPKLICTHNCYEEWHARSFKTNHIDMGRCMSRCRLNSMSPLQIHSDKLKRCESIMKL